MADPANEGDSLARRRIDICRLLIKERKRIGVHLGFELCPAPAWDMLLDLYVARHDRQSVQIWSLCVASNIPTSTAHRKIGEMVDAGILVREPEGGRVIVKLSEVYVSKLEALLDDLAALAALAGDTAGHLLLEPWGGTSADTVSSDDSIGR